MKTKYLLHHQGMGDFITCNALVRTLVERWELDKLFLFCPRKYAWNVAFMYRDDPRIEALPVDCGRRNQWDIECKMLEMRGIDPHQNPRDWESGSDGEFFKLGFGELDKFWPANPEIKSCDEAFYRMAGVPYEYRFTKFSMLRDAEAEKAVSYVINPSGEPYIFLHDEPGDVWDSHYHWLMTEQPRHSFHYNTSFLNIPLVLLGDFLENATELHLQNSSIRCLVDTPMLHLSRTKLYLHDKRGGVGNSMRDWIVLKQDGTREEVKANLCVC